MKAQFPEDCVFRNRYFQWLTGIPQVLLSPVLKNLKHKESATPTDCIALVCEKCFAVLA